MSALKMKIRVDSLVIEYWSMWEEEDQDFIRKCFEDNNLDAEYTPTTVILKGKHENLFTFMYDVAYRYDIELV